MNNKQSMLRMVNLRPTEIFLKQILIIHNNITNNNKTICISNQCNQDVYREICTSHHSLIANLQFEEEDPFHQEILIK